jgi:HK97 family phage prohead protease
MTIERRFTKIEKSDVKCRAEEDQPRQINGYGAVFYDGTPETEYRLWDDMVERIDSGAFDEVINDNDARGLFNHNTSAVLGRTSAGTMRLVKDERGLSYEIDMPNTTTGSDVFESISRGDITGSSFAFVPNAIEWSSEKRDNKTIEVRTVKGVEALYDVGPVTFPAYEAATTSARDKESIENERKELSEERNKEQLELEKSKKDKTIQLTKLRNKRG